MTQNHRPPAHTPSLRHAIRDLVIASARAGDQFGARRPELRWIVSIGLVAVAGWAFAISDGPSGPGILAWTLGLLAIGSLVSSVVTALRRR